MIIESEMFGLKVLYLTFPQAERIVNVDFTPGSSFTIRYDNFTTKIVEANGVNAEQHRSGIEFTSPLKSQAKLLLHSHFNRSEIDIDTISISPEGLERHLQETKKYDYSHEAVQQIAREICSQLPVQHRNNHYAQIEGIVSWIRDNVKGVPLPSETLDSMEAVIKKGEWSPLEVLSLILKEDYVRTIIPQIKINLDKTEARAMAKDLAYQAIDIDHHFMSAWLGRGAVSASATVDRKEGNCQGMANAYVALARYLGIPTKEVSGYVKVGDNGGHHAWVASHLVPYGWVEVDPTLGKTKDFPFQDYGYALFHESKGEKLPSFSMEENSKIE